MNPGSNIGKKELPSNIRNKFVEFFVEEIEDFNSLEQIVKNRSKLQLNDLEAEKVVKVYLKLREFADKNLLEDGFGRVPDFTLR